MNNTHLPEELHLCGSSKKRLIFASSTYGTAIFDTHNDRYATKTEVKRSIRSQPELRVHRGLSRKKENEATEEELTSADSDWIRNIASRPIFLYCKIRRTLCQERKINSQFSSQKVAPATELNTLDEFSTRHTKLMMQTGNSYPIFNCAVLGFG